MMKLKIGELQACATFDMETRLKTLQEARQKIEQATNQAGISKAMEEDVVRAFGLPSFKWQEERPRRNSVSSIKVTFHQKGVVGFRTHFHDYFFPKLPWVNFPGINI